MEIDLDGHITYCNAGVTELLGFASDELHGQPIEAILPDELHADHRARFRRYVEERRKGLAAPSRIVGRQRFFSARDEQCSRLRYLAVRKDGQSMPISLTIDECLDARGRLSGFVGVILDQREQDELRHRIHVNAEYDELTGLLCWRGMRKRMQQRLRTGERPDCAHGVLYIDIDQFAGIAFRSRKSANGALTETARWLARTIRLLMPGGDVLLSRHFNASEFLVALHGCDRDTTRHIGERLVGAFRDLNLGSFDAPYFGSISVGMAWSEDPRSFEFTVASAARACFAAKSLGHDRLVEAASPGADDFALGERIRQGISLGSISLLAQRILPPCGTGSPESTGLRFEILARFREADDTLLPIERVFAVAERLGIAHKLDEHVLLATLDALADESLDLGRLDYCSINLTGSTLSRTGSFGLIERAIRASGVDPGRLCFEITEGTEITDTDHASRLMQRLRELGCRIAIDDFGTGHSNFQSLVRAPVDCIKIDGSYTRRILHEPALRVDFQGMMASARVRGIEVVAEVVEDEAIARELANLGVAWAQGYHLHRPEPLRPFLGACLGES